VRRIAILLFLATAAGAHDDQEIAAQIAPGYRSVALAFLAGGLNGIEAHSRIDVYATFSPPSGPKTVEIGQGRRLVNIEIPDYEAVELKPGIRVDVFTTFPEKNPSSGELELVTRTILQDVVVRQIAAHPSSTATLTIVVSREDLDKATLVSLAHIAIRGTADAAMHPLEPASFSRLFK